MFYIKTQLHLIFVHWQLLLYSWLEMVNLWSGGWTLPFGLFKPVHWTYLIRSLDFSHFAFSLKWTCLPNIRFTPGLRCITLYFTVSLCPLFKLPTLQYKMSRKKRQVDSECRVFIRSKQQNIISLKSDQWLWYDKKLLQFLKNKILAVTLPRGVAKAKSISRLFKICCEIPLFTSK